MRVCNRIALVPWALITKAMQPNYCCLMSPFRPDHMGPSELKRPASSSTTWHIKTENSQNTKPAGLMIKISARTKINDIDKWQTTLLHIPYRHHHRKITNPNQRWSYCSSSSPPKYTRNAQTYADFLQWRKANVGHIYLYPWKGVKM